MSWQAEEAQTYLREAWHLTRDSRTAGSPDWLISFRSHLDGLVALDRREEAESDLLDVERRLAVSYEITNLTRERRSARGLTTLAVVDPEGRMRMETPPELVERIRGAAA